MLLGGPIGSKLEGLLEFVSESTTEVDDVHIILEYPEGAEWAGQRASLGFGHPRVGSESGAGPDGDAAGPGSLEGAAVADPLSI